VLSEFFEVLYEHEQRSGHDRELVAALKHLPNGELFKLANGKGESVLGKEAYGGSDEWLSKYRGTELFERASALEEQLVEVEMQEQERRRAERALRSEDLWDLRDRICLEKRVLDLELACLEEARLSPAHAGGEEVIEEAPPSAGESSPALAPAPPPSPKAQGGGEDKHAALEWTEEAKRLGRELARRDFSTVSEKRGALGAVVAGGKALAGRAGSALSKGLPALGARSKALGGALGAGAERFGTALEQGGALGGARALGRMGVDFARRNPLGAAALAGGAGLVAGKMLD
jgi:hypothetical protein